ncbi:glutamate-5-semialdehyde dehydrogenase [Veillonella intestinalis]|uniref:glutamate-5-semialdehyde dehydrogenase n=1 Tax=Veillonella intestinalis TaxID=2941341 RepID=UPI00203FB8AB|nr:glutamate-5-semialdehyde dehydrogenase [Veillonella intestinalis]
MTDYATLFETMGQQARMASTQLQVATTETKNSLLVSIADILEANIAAILTANDEDMKQADSYGLPAMMLDRLRLTEDRIKQMALGVRQLVDLSDPIGEVIESSTRPNGMAITKVRVPLGVIAMFYEARPNVTVDAAALSLKTGNAVILRGGKEAFNSNQCLVTLIRQALTENNLPADAVQLVTVTDRAAVSDLLKQREYIDVVIPRGGAGLIKRIVEESRIPVIETGSGVVHVYIDKDCDTNKIVPIVINAKVQRPSVCNSAETLLIHEEVAPKLLPEVAQALFAKQVELRGDATSRAIVPAIHEADSEAWSTEYNDLIMNVKVVSDVAEAIHHINQYGTKHSECIITENKTTAQTFLQQVDASTVYVNVSTRFTDGFEFGLGAEIGISTQKLHARGPMGLLALTSYKYYVEGDGQIRS